MGPQNWGLRGAILHCRLADSDALRGCADGNLLGIEVSRVGRRESETAKSHGSDAGFIPLICLLTPLPLYPYGIPQGTELPWSKIIREKPGGFHSQGGGACLPGPADVECGK
jgi:hypothetical protein